MATGCAPRGGGVWTPGKSAPTTALFPDPFGDPASSVLPTNLSDAFSWCERVFERMGIYREAVKRKIAYFLTEIQIDAVDGQEGDKLDPRLKRNYEDIFNNEIGILEILLECLLDKEFYGNVLFSTISPTQQFATCPHCSFDAPYRAVRKDLRFRARWQNFALHAFCPLCDRSGVWKMSPRRKGDKEPLIIKRWSPHEIELVHDIFTGQSDYYWKLPGEYKEQLRRGEDLAVSNAYEEVLDAARGNKVIEFDPGFVTHMREMSLSGQVKDNRGWGISSTLAQFGQVYYVQILHLYNQAFAMDYVVPFRLVTPDNSSGTTEPAETLGGSRFAARMNHLFKRRNTNPFEWNFLPFPVKYQTLGGDAQQFAPKDLIEQGYDWMLASVGTPVEFYKANLSAQNAIPMLRVFESQNTGLWYTINRIVQKVADRIAEHRGLDPVKASLIKPVVGDDISLQQLKLQLAINKQISLGTALRPLGIDQREEVRKQIDEEAYAAEQAAQKQKEIEQQQIGEEMFPPVGAMTLMQQAQGGMPGQPGQPGMPAGGQPGMPPMPGGMPMGGAMGQPGTIEDLATQAQQWAQYLLPLDETTRKSQLSQLKQQNENLQMMVVSMLDKMRAQQNTQGGAMLRQQGAPPM